MVRTWKTSFKSHLFFLWYRLCRYRQTWRKIRSTISYKKGLWPQDSLHISYVVFTGGEPTLQVDEELITACKDAGFVLGIETNGTKAYLQVSIFVSPLKSKLSKTQNESAHLSAKKMNHKFFGSLWTFYLQPMDNHAPSNIQAVVNIAQQATVEGPFRLTQNSGTC